MCAPIKCDDDDDGPDFSRMAKKNGKAAGANSMAAVTSSKAKKGDDIRKRFMIERPKGAAPHGMIIG